MMWLLSVSMTTRFPRIVEPNLTTVHYPGRAMGDVAASTMIRILEGTQFEKVNSIILSHELIIRQSSLKSGNTSGA